MMMSILKFEFHIIVNALSIPPTSFAIIVLQNLSNPQPLRKPFTPSVSRLSVNNQWKETVNALVVI